MKKRFQYIFDSIFPPSKETLLVRALSTDDVTQIQRIGIYDGTITLSIFKEPAVRALIHEAKFHQNTRAFTILSTLLTHYLARVIEKELLIIPIPLSKTRYRTRGYNQVTEVCKRACNIHSRHILADTILFRTRDTKPQVTLHKEARLTNIEGAFITKYPEQIRNKDIVIVDDVTTTGATLQTARAELARHNPKSITCIALAH